MPARADQNSPPSPRSLTTLLVTLLLLLLFPGFGNTDGGALRVAGNLLLTVLLLAGVLSLARHPALRQLFWALVLAALAARWLSETGWLPALRHASMVLTLVSLLAIAWVVLLQVSQPGVVTAHHVRGAMALYLLIAAVFAYAYALLELARPGAFQLPAAQRAEAAGPETFFYFSVVTLTTLGYGDVTAVDGAARDLVMLEALLGQLYPAIIIARLVTLELNSRRAAPAADDSGAESDR